MRLDQRQLAQAARTLAKEDPYLGLILDKYGPPPLWEREEGFATLVRIILEQQVSLASAQATYLKLTDAVNKVTPERFLKLSADRLRSIGFSRQKTHYCQTLAGTIIEGQLRINELNCFDSIEVKRQLMSVKGIGHWTSDIYLMMALRRVDVWPHGDLALAIAYQEVHELEHRPSYDELQRLSARWAPWRAVAARMLWHFYLRERGREMIVAG